MLIPSNCTKLTRTISHHAWLVAATHQSTRGFPIILGFNKIYDVREASKKIVSKEYLSTYIISFLDQRHFSKNWRYLGLNTSLAAPGALAHRLQHLTARLTQNGQWGLERG